MASGHTVTMMKADRLGRSATSQNLCAKCAALFKSSKIQDLRRPTKALLFRGKICSGSICSALELREILPHRQMTKNLKIIHFSSDALKEASTAAGMIILANR
jgi:hypothetical protein